MDKNVMKIHDGIVGVLLVLSTVLGFKVAPVWFCLAGTIGVLMIVSAFTGFCPVYFLLGVCGIKNK